MTRDVAGVLAAVLAHAVPEAELNHLAVSNALEPDVGLMLVRPGRKEFDPEEELIADMHVVFPTVQADTSRDFFRRQRKSAPLPPAMPWPVGVQLVGDDEFEDWDTYPDSVGIVTFAPVGFSRDGGQALAFYSHVRGRLAGRGMVVLLERVDGVWRVRDVRKIWVS